LQPDFATPSQPVQTAHATQADRPQDLGGFEFSLDFDPPTQPKAPEPEQPTAAQPEAVEGFELDLDALGAPSDTARAEPAEVPQGLEISAMERRGDLESPRPETPAVDEPARPAVPEAVEIEDIDFESLAALSGSEQVEAPALPEVHSELQGGQVAE